MAALPEISCGLAWQQTDLTNFDVHTLDVASSFGDIDCILVLQIRYNGKDLGRELDGAAFGVLGFGGLAGFLVERGAVLVSFGERRCGSQRT